MVPRACLVVRAALVGADVGDHGARGQDASPLLPDVARGKGGRVCGRGPTGLEGDAAWMYSLGVV